MKRGTIDITNIKRGSTDIKKVYRGEVLVWPDEPSFEEFVLTIGENRLVRKWDLDGNQDTSGNWPIDVGSPAVRICSLDYSITNQFFMINGHRGTHTLDGVSNIAGYERFDLDGNSILSSGSLSGVGITTDSRAISIIDSIGDFFPEAPSLIRVNKDNTTVLVNVSTRLGRVFSTYTNGNYIGLAGQRSAVPASLAVFEVDGTLTYALDVGSFASGMIYINDDDEVFVTVNDTNAVRKYNSAGTLLLTYVHGALLRSVKESSDGSVYISGNRTSNITHRKLDKDFNLVWSRDHGANATARGDKTIDIDSQGNIWFTFIRTSNITHRKYSPSGDLLVSIDHGSSTGNGIRIIRKNI